VSTDVTVAQSAPGPRTGRRRLVKVLPEDARRHNKSLVLQALFPEAELSRADIARMTGLTRVTVSDLVGELAEEGLVRELGQKESKRPGKPGTLLSINPYARVLVALDLSDSETLNGALVDLSGRVLSRDAVTIGGAVGETAVTATIELAQKLVAVADRPVLGVGIGTPGMVDADGVVLHAPNRSWESVPLRERVAEALELPVLVSNDADAAARAEHSYGGRAETVLVVHVALGVGAGLFIDGKLVHGHRSAAGEIGHVSIQDDGVLCACGKRGCLETFTSVPALRAQLDELTGEPTDLSQRAAILSGAGEKLSRVVAPLVAAIDFDEIVLSGTLDLLGGDLVDSVRENVRMRTRSAFRNDVPVRTTDLGEDTVLLGAAAMVLSGQLGVS